MRSWNGKSVKSSKSKGGKRKKQNVVMVRWLTRFVFLIQNIFASALNHARKWLILIVPCPSISVGDDAEVLTPGLLVMLEHGGVLMQPKKKRRIASDFVIMLDGNYLIVEEEVLWGATMRKRENGKGSGGICSHLVVVHSETGGADSSLGDVDHVVVAGADFVVVAAGPSEASGDTGADQDLSGKTWPDV